MGEYLLFRLYGLMASWGDIAVGEHRPSFAHPSKSAILGLVAAAVGLTRDSDEAQRELAQAYGFAVRVDVPGFLLRDYHTVQVPSSGTGRNRRTFATRKEELEVPGEELNTILSSRDYRCDAVYTVCLWALRGSPPYTLKDMAERLRVPVFVLYLGRKSCPPALPLQPVLVTADTVRQAFEGASFRDGEDLKGIPEGKLVAVYWEGAEESGYVKVHSITRRDIPLNRQRWQFADREEHYGVAGSMAQSREE